MKKVLRLSAFFLLLTFIYAFGGRVNSPSKTVYSKIDTIPNNTYISNASTLYHLRGWVTGDKGIVVSVNDTADNLSTPNIGSLTILPSDTSLVNPPIYMSNGRYWVKWQISGASTISKYNDSTLLICNASSCDTIVVSVAAQPIQNWTVLSDTSIQVCGTNACDTVYTSPIYYGQTYVDSVTVGIGNTAVKDTVNWYKDGIKHQAGLLGKEIQTGLPLYVQYNSDSSTATIRILQADGIISGGIVTWSGSGLTYYVSACTYQIGGVIYSSPQTTITLAAADPTYARQDVFIVDTTGTASYLEGTPSASPTAPQTDASQLALTGAITLNAGDTIPSTGQSLLIYDEGTGAPTEANTSSAGTITYDSVDISNPFHGIKDFFVSSYNSGAFIYFTLDSTLNYASGDVLNFHIYTNGTTFSHFPHLISVYLYNGSSPATTPLSLTTAYGFNGANGNVYQDITIPLSAFSWSNSGQWNKVAFQLRGNDNSGTGGFFLDYMTLQSGIPNTPPATDYSNKVDSTTTVKVNDSTYVGLYWIKGISYQKGDTIHIHASSASGTVLSVTGNPTGLVDNTDPTNPVVQQDALKLNISDTASMLSPYLRIVDTTGMRLQPIAGTNMTITGTYPNLTFNSTASGGSSTIDTTVTATTNGQTNFVFASLPSRYIVFVNNMPFTNFTTSGGNTIIVGFTDIVAGDIIRLYQTQ